jgi:glucosamine-6-phosphate deaminase
MQVIIRDTEDNAVKLAAKVACKDISQKPHIVLGLATGRTMVRLYSELVKCHERENLDFSLCRTFNLDEYIGLPTTHPQSYRSYMNSNLFNHINIDIRNTHIPNGMSPDVDKECLIYEETIKDCGGIDLQILGIGSDGHIGFNEPLSALRSRTRAKSLTPETMKQNGPLFKKPDAMPGRAITMGLGTIMEAKKCLMLVTGKSKASILAKAIEGPITSMVTATTLQLHHQCVIIADKAAASKLKCKQYYKWIWENEPEWKEYHGKY